MNGLSVQVNGKLGELNFNFKHHFKSQNMRVLNDQNHRITPSWAGLAECAAAGERIREGSEAS